MNVKIDNLLQVFDSNKNVWPKGLAIYTPTPPTRFFIIYYGFMTPGISRLCLGLPCLIFSAYETSSYACKIV